MLRQPIIGAALLVFMTAANGGTTTEPTFQIYFENGRISPERLQVPAKTRFRLQLINLNDTPAEFESRELYKEKVLAPKSESIMVIRTLDPGEYTFFDDFRPDAPPAILVAR